MTKIVMGVVLICVAIVAIVNIGSENQHTKAVLIQTEDLKERNLGDNLTSSSAFKNI